MMDWWRKAPLRHPQRNKGDDDGEEEREGRPAERERDGRALQPDVLDGGYEPAGGSGDPLKRDGQGGRTQWRERRSSYPLPLVPRGRSPPPPTGGSDPD